MDLLPLGLGLSALGAGINANASALAGERNAAIGQHNARLAEIAAADALQRGNAAAAQIALKAARIAGKQRAGYAASGVDVSSGSPANVIADSAGMAELDKQTIRNNAAREAWGFTQKAQQFRMGASLDASAATNRAAGDLFAGASNVASYGSRYLRVAGQDEGDSYSTPGAAEDVPGMLGET